MKFESHPYNHEFAFHFTTASYHIPISDCTKCRKSPDCFSVTQPMQPSGKDKQKQGKKSNWHFVKEILLSLKREVWIWVNLWSILQGKSSRTHFVLQKLRETDVNRQNSLKHDSYPAHNFTNFFETMFHFRIWTYCDCFTWHFYYFSRHILISKR